MKLYQDDFITDAHQECYHILRQYFGHETACAFMGNIQQESAFKLDALGFDKTGSYGLCQWQGPRKHALETFCDRHHLLVRSYASQIAFINYEWTHTEISAQAHTARADGIREKTIAISQHYERPAAEYAHNDKRVRYALAFDKAFHPSRSIDNDR